MRIATEKEILDLGFTLERLACKCCGVCRVDIGMLQRLRCFMDMTDHLDREITSCCRCWNHHVTVYRQIYGKDWNKYITIRSKHLITDRAGKELVSTAWDIGGPVEDLRYIHLILESTWHGGYHFYDNKAHPSLHFDIDTRNRRW